MVCDPFTFTGKNVLANPFLFFIELWTSFPSSQGCFPPLKKSPS